MEKTYARFLKNYLYKFFLVFFFDDSILWTTFPEFWNCHKSWFFENLTSIFLWEIYHRTDMTTITLQTMAITITISKKIMMVLTIIHQMDWSKFDGINCHHPLLFTSIYPIIFRNWIFFFNYCLKFNMYHIQFIATPILKRVSAHVFLKKSPVFA